MCEVYPRVDVLANAFARRPEYSAIDFYRITGKVQLAIYNSIILAWREKVRLTTNFRSERSCTCAINVAIMSERGDGASLFVSFVKEMSPWTSATRVAFRRIETRGRQQYLRRVLRPNFARGTCVSLGVLCGAYTLTSESRGPWPVINRLLFLSSDIYQHADRRLPPGP